MYYNNVSLLLQQYNCVIHLGQVYVLVFLQILFYVKALQI